MFKIWLIVKIAAVVCVSRVNSLSLRAKIGAPAVQSSNNHHENTLVDAHQQEIVREQPQEKFVVLTQNSLLASGQRRYDRERRLLLDQLNEENPRAAQLERDFPLREHDYEYGPLDRGRKVYGKHYDRVEYRTPALRAVPSVADAEKARQQYQDMLLGVEPHEEKIGLVQRVVNRENVEKAGWYAFKSAAGKVVYYIGTGFASIYFPGTTALIMSVPSSAGTFARTAASRAWVFFR